MGALGDDHQVGLGDVRGGVRVVVGAVAHLGAEQRHQFVVVAGGQPERAGVVLLVGVGVVRQPLDPVPLGPCARIAEHRDAQFVGGVQHGELGEHRPHQGQRLLTVAGELHPGEAAQRHRDGQVGNGLVGLGEAAQRDRGERFEVLDGLGLRRQEDQFGAADAHADPDPAEVLVAGAAFPQPRPHRERPQLAWVGVVPQQGGPLLGRGGPGLAASLRQVPQVVAAFGFHPAAALRAAAAHLGQRHADHGDAHHPGHHVSGRAHAADAEHEHHRTGAQPHRQVQQRGTEVHAGGFTQYRRLGQLHLPVGHRRPVAAR